jgi:hypothetical protein
MRGRLYPQPRQRYERFRLNPYSPLYEGLALFVSIPPVSGIIPELHGPYALPGVAYRTNGYGAVHQFFPEIGRAALTPNHRQNVPTWSTVPIPPQNVSTLTTMIRTAGSTGEGIFVMLSGLLSLEEYSGTTYPRYTWANVDTPGGLGRSVDKFWPLNTWFTYSVIARPGSVSGYLSNWGILDVELYWGYWPSTLKGSQSLQIASVPSGTFVSDTFVHLRELSLTELRAISDLGNVDYRMPGEPPLILPVRTYWPSVLPVAPSYLKRRSLGARSGTREAAL